MTRPRRQLARRIWIAVAVAVALPILVPLIALPGAKSEVLRALNAGLGRSVQAQQVRLQLFPRPGFELDQVRLGEDPAFGLEDMVVADDAVASVRLSSLFSGRLVFSRIHLDGASINLVRNREGEWNVAALLDRTAHASGQGRGANALTPSQRFPYLEWSDTRVNFKLEQTKQRFYLDQVQGSLARDAQGWRLQARFQPQRTDLILSDTGDVTVDGRWPAASEGFHDRPFDLVVRLSNSYLAASSALVVGHDAGVHGVVSAQVHVQGTGQRFELSGMVQAQSLRRWDLLPPPASVEANFLAAYYPGQDRLVLAGAGDAGFRHIHLQGEVANVFTRPTGTLELQLRKFPAAGLMPLLMAVKANLPADLQAGGLVDGAAALRWNSGVSGQGKLAVTGLQLVADGDSLTLPQAALQWDGESVRMAPETARLQLASGARVALRVGAQLDRKGFALDVTSPDLSAAAIAGLGHVLGMNSPWPAALTGSATARLALGGSWADFRQAGWSGSLLWKQAHFRPAGANLTLSGVSLDLQDPQPRRAAFTAVLGTGDAPVMVTASWPVTGTQPAAFTVTAARLQDRDVWALLHPQPSGLMQRMLGDTTPDWVERLRAAGTVRIGQLEWRGLNAGLELRLETGAGGAWNAPRMRLELAQGDFEGSGALRHGNYEVSGMVMRPLNTAALLAPTTYRGLLNGALSGTLTMQRAAGANGFSGIAASGRFDLRRGSLATVAGPQPFERLQGSYQVSQGVAALSDVEWIEGGARWTGTGNVNLDGAGAFTLKLDDGARRRVITGRLRKAKP